jgi:uncharacterized membrane protein
LALIALLAVLAALGRAPVSLAALPLCLALPLIVDRRAPAGAVFAGLLLVLGLGLIAGTELVYLRDFLEGSEWRRMNTLFKFSVPAWLFLGLAGGYILARLWALANRAPAWLAIPWQVVAGVLLSGGLVFLAFGVPARVDDRFPGARPPLGTLDAMAYMRVGEYTWPGVDSRVRLGSDYDALKWMLANVKGTPVVAEAPAGSYVVGGEQVGYDYYRAGGLRVASIIGLPVLVGQHQYEQRPADQVLARTAAGQELFETTDLAVARRLMRELRVGYVYVGQLERILFSPEALAKFDVLAGAGELVVAYQNQDVTIYRVAILGAVSGDAGGSSAASRPFWQRGALMLK